VDQMFGLARFGKHHYRQQTRENKLNLLTEENIKLQVKHLRNLSLIKTRHRKGKTPRIHGHGNDKGAGGRYENVKYSVFFFDSLAVAVQVKCK
jgi:carbonic anhydrase